VGRHPRCDIVVAGSNVSRRHAELILRDGVWVIRDLGSTNGTTVNGSLVGRSELRPGDLVGLADQLVQID
jgi:pSer/pThr/pTyr-binding forkhead associated (FHA) protein